MPVTLLLLLASALLHLRYIGAAIRTELHRPPRLVSRRLVDAVGTFLPFGVRFSLSDQRPWNPAATQHALPWLCTSRHAGGIAARDALEIPID